MIAMRARKRVDYFDRDIKIHLCKDGTISYCFSHQRAFNNVALLAFTVDTEAQAKALQVRFGRLQFGSHPEMPRGTPWYRLSSLPDRRDISEQNNQIELEQLASISEMFNKWWLEVGHRA